MKTNFKKAACVLGILALAIVGCKKETLNPISNDFISSDIQSLTTQSESENDAVDATYNETTNEIISVNDGIAADYVVTENDFSTLDGTGPNTNAHADLVDQSFLRCLKTLKLEDAQIAKIRVALGEYDDCKASAVKRARAIHADLVTKYKELAAEQARLLNAGKITKDEYEARIERIRKAFQKELRALQLKEKLQDAFKNCYAKFLRQLNGILTERQWKAFVDCHTK